MRGIPILVISVSLIACGKNASAPRAAGDATSAEMKLDGFSTPESVLYDAAGDVYVVSNIDGSPGDKDGNGFLSRVTPDGKIELHWVDGLDAPKGSAIIGDTLYVADIDQVRMFDRASGAAKGEIAIDGATFLNDLAAGGAILWLTDTGLGADMSPAGTDAVYRIDTANGNAVSKALGGKELGGPNGIVPTGDGATVVTFGSGEIFTVVPKDGAWAVGAKHTLPKGQLDGIVVSGNRTFVSSWADAAVYEVAADGTAKEVATGLDSPADIGLDTKRNRLLVPLFQKNTIQTHAL